MFLEEFEPGKIFTTGELLVTQERIDEFASLTGDLNPLHIDEAFASGTIFKRTIAHGMLVFSLALGLWYEAGFTRQSVVAFLGLNEVKFRAPVFPGMRIRVSSRVKAARVSESRPDSGIVTFEDSIVNESGELVATFERTLLLRKKDATL